jgi:hypothetical protein
VRIEVLDEAEADLVTGFHFYERQEAGLGGYFLNSLFSDIDSLLADAWRGGFRLRSTTRPTRMSSVSMRFSIVVEILRGSASV